MSDIKQHTVSLSLNGYIKSHKQKQHEDLATTVDGLIIIKFFKLYTIYISIVIYIEEGRLS
jgi:hypothetical protein